MGEHDEWAALRRPLPGWWLGNLQRDTSYPNSNGLAFSVESADGRKYQCYVARDVLSGIVRDKVPAEYVDFLWTRYQDQFLSVAKRKIYGADIKGRPISISLADFVLGNYDL